jgi:hypothetical protein
MEATSKSSNPHFRRGRHILGISKGPASELLGLFASLVFVFFPFFRLLEFFLSTFASVKDAGMGQRER